MHNLDGFTENGGHYYSTVIFGSDNYRTSDDGEDLELFLSVMSDAEVMEHQGHSIIMAAQTNLDFSCKYSLDPQTLTSATEVRGESNTIAIARTSRGNFGYNIDVDEDSVLGHPINFSIVPTTPGIVYAKVVNCAILNEDESKRYDLTFDRNGDVCTDWLTAFSNDSGSWCTDQEQEFSFTSFKWDATKAYEIQKIRCIIELDIEHDATYNPGVCSQTTTTTTTTTTTSTSTTLSNIDECSLGSHNCHADATCTDTDGSFSCDCNAGYDGTGVVCSNIDECSLGSHDCHADATCIDTDGSYTCDCDSGDGKTTCFTRKFFSDAFPTATYSVDSEYNHPSYPDLVKERIVDGSRVTGYWHSNAANDGWVEFLLNQSYLFQSAIITRHLQDEPNRYKEVCLIVDDVVEACTDTTGYGAPYLVGNEITLSIDSPRYVQQIKLLWGDHADNYAQVVEVEFITSS